MITVRGLIDFEELRIRAVAGRGGLDAEVRWAHVSELEDPTPWLKGGELIMTTGIGIPVPAAAQVEYLRRLHAVGAVGLAAGDRMHAPPLASEALEFANDHDLPLLLVEREVPFIALAQTVAAANRDALHARLARHLRVYETLHDVALAKTDARHLFTRLSDVTGYDLYALTATGGPLFAQLDPPPQPLPAAKVIQCLEATSVVAVPFEAELHPKGFLLPIIAKRTRLGILAAFQRHTGEVEQLVLHHVATIASLFAVELLHEREQARRTGTERFARFMSEPDPFAGGLADLFPDARAGATACVVALQLPEPAVGWDDVHHRLLDAGFPHLLLRRSRSAYVVAVRDGLPGEELPKVLTAALPGSTLGMSEAAPIDGDVEGAFEEATWALRHALAEGRRWHCYRAADAIVPADAAALALTVKRVLGSLLAHDERSHGALYCTLTTFLGENRNWKTTAARLGIHRQTLVYRARRIEELTGRSLSTTDGICDLWLAVKAHEASQVGHRGPARGLRD